MIHESKWVVLGKPECPWCFKVCDLLAKYDIEYKYFDLITKPDLREFLIESGLTTVPQVYLNGQRLGGHDQVKQYLSLVYKGEDDRQIHLPY